MKAESLVALVVIHLRDSYLQLKSCNVSKLSCLSFLMQHKGSLVYFFLACFISF